ncbi:MAG TPA: MFS transporter [Gammaproteobacteria bacterium]|nr:MFS transporter [Gammaproteobacteria bacterium]
MLNTYPHKWPAFIGIALLSFGCYLDYTVVNVALPTIQKELQTDLSQLQWVMNIYFLALCVLAAIMGRCGDLYGRRRVFYLGVVIFALSSLLAGFAPNIHWLILGRLLQGAGAAIVFPLGPSLLPEAFPPNQRDKAIGWLGSLGGIALALGPVIGGLIVTYWGWRWIFFINIPIIILGFLFAKSSIKESRAASKQALDYKGMLLLAIMMGGVVLGLLHSASAGWINTITWLYLVIGVLAGVVLVKVEQRIENPLIDFSDFKNLIFYSGAVLSILPGMLSASALFFDPLYLQIIRGETVQTSGIVLFAIPIAVLVIALFVGWLIEKLGIINTIVLGLALGAAACLLQAFFSEAIPLWYIIIAFLCLGSLWAMGNTVPLIAAQGVVNPERKSVATGTMITMFNVGGSLGLALAVMIYHLSAMHRLTQQAHNFSYTEMAKLQQWVINPGHLLQETQHELHQVFNAVFIHGFTMVMLFLFALSLVLILSILGWRFVLGKKT